MKPAFRGAVYALVILIFGFLFSQTAFAQNCTPTISAQQSSAPVCEGGSVTLTASAAKSYQWSTGATTRSITVSKSGSYTVTTTTTDGCKGTSAPVTVSGKPDATFIDPVYSNFNYCTTTKNVSAFEFVIENASTTKETNTSYTVDWGDGTTETIGSDFNTAKHIYKSAGSYNIVVTALGKNGCTDTKSNKLFIGSNPGLGLGSAGNNTDCAPATYAFKITDVDGNSPLTVYTFQFDDGTPAFSYTHDNLPKDRIIWHTFTESSQSKKNGFTLTGVAENSCFTSTIRFTGIRISKSPIAEITANSTGCVGEPFKIQDTSRDGFDASSNSDKHKRNWSISPATGWVFISGGSNSASPVIKFNEPGQYTLTIEVGPLDPNSTCTGSMSEKVINIGSLPLTAVAAEKETICFGDSTALTASGADSYVWSPATGLSATTGSVVTAKPTATTTYTVTGISSTGCGVSKNITVTVNQLPDAPQVANQTVCPGTSTVLRVEKPVGDIRWYDAPKEGTLLAMGNAYATDVLYDTTTYYVETSVNGGCPSPRTPVTVNVRPETPAPIVAPATVCGEGIGATLVAEGGAGEYRWYDSETLDNLLFTGDTYTTEPLSDDRTYYVQASTDGCLSAVVAVPVKVMKTYVNNINGNTIQGPSAAICASQTPGIINGSTPNGGEYEFTYRWEQSQTSATEGFTTIKNADGKSYRPGALAVPTWFRRIAVSGPCAENISDAVLIDVLPAISNNTISQDQTICAGEVPLLLTGTAPAGGGGTGSYTYLWESSTDGSVFAPAAGSNKQESYTAPTPLSGTTFYRRVVTSNVCQAHVSNLVKVTVLPKIANNKISLQEQSVCSGSSPGTLTGARPTGGTNTYDYAWEYSNDGVTYSDAPGTNKNSSYEAGALTQATWFRRKAISGACYSYSDAIKVEVLEQIANNEITESQTICTGSAPAQLTGSLPTGGNGSYTYVWEYSATNTAGSFKAVASSGTAAAYQPGALYKTTYFRRIAYSGACSQLSNVVEITVSPEISNNAIALDQTIYSGQIPAPLTGTVPDGGSGQYTYRWEYSTDGRSFYLAAEPNTGKNYAPGALTQDTWYRRTAYSGGCDNSSNTIKISITPAIANNHIQADQIICYNNKPAAITGTAPSGGYGAFEYLWQQSIEGPGKGWVTAVGSGSTQDYSPGVLKQHTWFRRIVISSSRTDTSAAVMITVNPAMSNNVISTSQSVCYDTAPSVLLGSMPKGGSGNYTYLWEQSVEGPTQGFSTAPGVNNRQEYAPKELRQNTWFRRVVTSESCDRILSNAVSVKVMPLPPMPVVKGATICGGNTATLTATGEGGRLEWYTSAAGGQPVFVGSSFTTPVLHHNTTYYVQEVQSCASARQEVTVKVSETTADAGQDATIVKGRNAELHGSGGKSYSWSPATGLSDPHIANPVAMPEETTTYTLTVETEGGCTFTDQVTVTVLPFVSVPNTFTPNRDGINDTWEIENIAKYPNCRVQVFNQWGNEVFSSVGYSKPWDGLFKGQELPIATYYYIIQLDKNEKPISGSITIVK